MEDDQYTNLQKYGSKAYTSNSNQRTIFLPQSQTKNHYFHRTSNHYRQQQQQQQFNENEHFHENFHYAQNRNDLETKTETVHGSYRKDREHHERQQPQQHHNCDYLQNDNFDNFLGSQVKLKKNYCSDPMFDSITDQQKSLPLSSYQYEEATKRHPSRDNNNESTSYWKSSESGRIHSSSGNTKSYIPPNAHVPIERYVPKTEPYIDIKQLPVLYSSNDYNYSLTRNKLCKPPKFSEKETQCNLMNNSIIVSYSLDNRLFPKSKIYQNNFCSKHYTNYRFVFDRGMKKKT